MAIIILGDEEDDHVIYMLDHLRRIGSAAEVLDAQFFPTEMQITFEPTGAAGEIHLPEGKSVKLSEISAVYWRNYNDVQIPPLDDAEQAFISESDSRGLFESFLLGVDTRWVNGWEAVRLHMTKPIQLQRVASAGVPIPKTLLTNEPAAVRRFAAETPNAIYKPVIGGAHTRRLTAKHLEDDQLDYLQLAPITLQEEVPGTNIRVFVAGERVMAAEVRTEQLDFRDDPEPRVHAVDIPDDVAGQAKEIARLLHMVWTGIDYRLTPDGHYVFLEANPSPMFIVFEEDTGHPLTESLTALLLGETPR